MELPDNPMELVLSECGGYREVVLHRAPTVVDLSRWDEFGWRLLAMERMEEVWFVFLERKAVAHGGTDERRGNDHLSVQDFTELIECRSLLGIASEIIYGLSDMTFDEHLQMLGAMRPTCWQPGGWRPMPTKKPLPGQNPGRG